MKNNPKVSVCMIAFNVDRYIQKAIEGVLMQEVDFDIELIISNDNSPDKTESVVHDIIKNHPKGKLIKYKRQDKNIGSTLNYLWVLENSKGEYISICDSDDFWSDPNKLQKQVDFLEKHQQFIGSFHNRYKCDEFGNVTSTSIPENEKSNWGFDDLILRMPEIPSASVVFRKRDDFNLPKEFKKVIVNGDTFLWAYLLQYGQFYYDQNILPSYYRQHSNGLWSSKNSFKKTNLSYNTYLLLQKSFPDKQSIKDQLFEIKNNLFFYAYKEKEIAIFLKYYFINLFSCFIRPKYFKSFLKIHRPFLKRLTA
jgi:glycosyltransferase involved in cell wall biosynthesis